MRSYWLDLFTGSTWQEFLDAGGGVSGFRERRWRTVEHIKAGDYLLCYLTGISRWIGLFEVTSTPFRDATPIWKDEDFPCRVWVKVLITLKPETAVPVLDLKDRLSIFRDLSSLAPGQATSGDLQRDETLLMRKSSSKRCRKPSTILLNDQ